MRRSAAVVLAVILASCAGSPQTLPVGVSACNGVVVSRGVRIDATIENKADRPISALQLTAAFYQNFRYQRLDTSAHLRRALDPGEKSDVRFDFSQTNAPFAGQAIRCVVTQIRYLDGTVQNAPAAQ